MKVLLNLYHGKLNTQELTNCYVLDYNVHIENSLNSKPSTSLSQNKSSLKK